MPQPWSRQDRSGAARWPARLVGAALKIAATLVFVLVALLVRRLSSTIPTGEIIFCRSAGAVVAVLALAAWRGQLAVCFSTARLRTHVGRGCTGFAALALNFISLGLLPLAVAQTLFYLSPIFIVVFGRLFLGERVGTGQWLATSLGFAGVLVILAPGLGDHGARPGVGIAIGVLGALLMAIALIQVRMLALTEPSTTMALYFGLTSTVLSLASLPLGWDWPTPEQAALLTGLALCGALAHILLAEAMARAEAAFLAPFDYLGIVWAVGLGAVILGEWPSTLVFMGMALVVGAAMLVGIGKPRD